MKCLLLTMVFAITTLSFPESLVAPTAEIYTPSPQFRGLTQPSTQVLDLPPVRYYQGSPGIASPGAYNHYQYLYFQPYNYRMPPYPYMYYKGKGQRDPGYFNWTSKPDSNQNEKIRFEGARIINSPSKLSENIKKQVSGTELLKLWVKAVGLDRSPPILSKKHTAVVLNTQSDSLPRIIKSVKLEGDYVVVRYAASREDKTKFYGTEDNAEAKGMLSIAIFKYPFSDSHGSGIPLRFIDESKDPEEDGKSTDPSAFIDEGFISCEVWNMSRFRQFTSSDVINRRISSKADLANYELLLELPDRVKAKMRNVDFEKEIIYLTGRAYSSQAKAADLFDRRIKRVANIGSSANEQLVDIHESTTSQEPLNREDLEDDSKLWFRGHYIVVEKSRNNPKPRYVLKTTEASN